MANVITGTAEVIERTWLNTLSVVLIGEDPRDQKSKRQIKKLKKQVKKLKKQSTP